MLDPQVTDKVRLKGPENEKIVSPEYRKILAETFEVVATLPKSCVTLKNQDGIVLRVHRSQVAEIVTQGVRPMPVLKPTTKPKETKSEKPKHKKEFKPIPFDLNGWMKDGDKSGVLMANPDTPFDAAKFTLKPHCLIDEKAGCYYILNIYTYPDGTISLGKKGTGIQTYPLKREGKHKGGKQGTKTAQQVFKSYLNKGYKVLQGELSHK